MHLKMSEPTWRLAIFTRTIVVLFVMIVCPDISAAGTEVVEKSSCTNCLRKCATTGCVWIGMKIGENPARCTCGGRIGLIPTGTWQLYSIQDKPLSCTESPESFVLVHRRNGGVNFTRNWEAYKAGFGDTDGDFWFGLEKTHQYTAACGYNLTVDMEDWDGNAYRSVYSNFSVGPETDNYRLSVSGYDADNSDGGNSLTAPNHWGRHNGMEFSTLDRDNDIWEPPTNNWDGHCAARLKGGWWYTDCMYSNPSGVYYTGGLVEDDGITWKNSPLVNDDYSFKTTKYTLVQI